VVRVLHGVLATEEMEAHGGAEEAAQLAELREELRRERSYRATVARYHAYKWLRRRKGGASWAAGGTVETPIAAQMEDRPPPPIRAPVAPAADSQESREAGPQDVSVRV
jgi:hypothetical protein